ncbi:MAG: type II toxin-antitoxin system HipA family toxin [Sphingobacteriia bacterium]|nr:type II toxin-antitoxin system HipA family toxin [Sphingobacteriia bacterium]
MFKPVEQIEVFYSQNRVGRLVLAPDHCCVFEYDPEWILTGFSISPFYLPLKLGIQKARPHPFDGLFGVFNDSLPDGWGKLLTDRWLRKQGIQSNSITVLDRLSLVGSTGMGALTYKPDKNAFKEFDQLPIDFYAKEVEKILQDENVDSLDQMMKTAGSSIGARPKVLVKIDDEEWLVKFKSTLDPDHVGKIEYHYANLARKCGIEMPDVKLYQDKWFGVRRFDIVKGSRFHVHSASGLLYASHRLPSLDYTELLKATMALTHDFIEVAKMFRLMVFNVLIGNKDDHAKNFAFIYQNRKWKLSPAYDLLPSDGIGGQHTTSVNGEGNPTIYDCLEVARKAGIPVKKATEIILEVEAGLSGG